MYMYKYNKITYKDKSCTQMHARFLKSTYKLVTSINYLIKNFTSRNQSYQSSLVEYNCCLPNFSSLMTQNPSSASMYRVQTQTDENDRHKRMRKTDKERGERGGERERRGKGKKREKPNRAVCLNPLNCQSNNLTQVRTEVLFTQCQISSSLPACRWLNNHNKMNNWLIRFGGYLSPSFCIHVHI